MKLALVKITSWSAVDCRPLFVRLLQWIKASARKAFLPQLPSPSASKHHPCSRGEFSLWDTVLGLPGEIFPALTGPSVEIFGSLGTCLLGTECTSSGSQPLKEPSVWKWFLVNNNLSQVHTANLEIKKKANKPISCYYPP